MVRVPVVSRFPYWFDYAGIDVSAPLCFMDCRGPFPTGHGAVIKSPKCQLPTALRNWRKVGTRVGASLHIAVWHWFMATHENGKI